MLDLPPAPRVRHLVSGLLAALLLLVAAAPASAAIFDDVFADFAKDGAIDPCTFTSAQLKEVRDDVPPDIEQYAPDFPAALTLAIEARGKGNCSRKAEGSGGGDGAAAPATGGGSTPAAPASPEGAPATPTPDAGAAPAPSGATPQPTPPPAPAAAAADGAIAEAALVEPTSGRSDGLPAAIVGLGALAGLLAIIALAWLLARALAYEPRWLPAARHSWQEAGWRMSATWADFTDWVRLGR